MSMNEVLYETVRLGNLEGVKYMFEERYIEAKEVSSDALLFSICHDHKEIAKYLKEYHQRWYSGAANFSMCMQRSVMFCIMNNKLEKLRFLIEDLRGSTNYFYANCAASCGHVEVLSYLLNRGHFAFQCEKGLVNAIKKGFFEVVQTMVEAGTRVEKHGDEVVKICLENDYMDILRYLSEKEALQADLTKVFI